MKACPICDNRGVSPSLVDGFLHLLKAEPTLLPEAPSEASAAHIDQRRLSETHSCLRCGESAQEAFVADTEIGPRWLDLCHACAGWLRKGTS